MDKELARDDHREPLAEADVGQDLVLAAHARILQLGAPTSRGRPRPDRAEAAQRLVQQPLAELERLLVLHRLQEMADVRARLAGDHVAEPRRVRFRVHGRDDFDPVAAS